MKMPPKKNEELVVNIEPLLIRRWVCQVVRSGYHNGANCRPDEPHVDWGCAYRFEFSLEDNEKNRKLLGITEEIAKQLG